MPDIDPLAFGIRFALTHETVGREARKLIRSLTEHRLCNRTTPAGLLNPLDLGDDRRPHF
jgi:hypothetical protein